MDCRVSGTPLPDYYSNSDEEKHTVYSSPFEPFASTENIRIDRLHSFRLGQSTVRATNYSSLRILIFGGIPTIQPKVLGHLKKMTKTVSLEPYKYPSP